MAANNELKTSRLTGTTDDGPDVPTAMADLETALRTIFGIPADTVMAEAMQIAGGPDVTMTGTLSVDTPTSDLHAATKAYADGEVTGWNPGAVFAYRSSSQNVATSNWVTVNFTNESFDTVGLHDTTYNSARITAAEDGVYFVTFYLSLTGTMAEGDVTVQIIKNGVTVLASVRDGFEDPYYAIPWSQPQTEYYATPHIRFETILDLDANDYIHLQIHQNSGYTVGLATGYNDSGFGVYKIRSV